MEMNTLSRQLLFNTVPLEVYDKEENILGTGTSFIISYESNIPSADLFLVTNKHVICGGKTLCFYLTRFENGRPQIGSPLVIRLDSAEAQFHGHPNSEVDISVLPFSWILEMVGQSGVKSYFKTIDSQIVVSEEEKEKMDVIEEVLFIGYPNGMYDTSNYTPITRSGITATPIQLDFCERPVFLIDASVFPGSSGSPVFSFRRSWKGGIVDVRLLGVVAEVFTQEDQGTFHMVPAPTQVVPIVEFRQMMDLGVVYKSHLVIETIEDWCKTVGRSREDN